MKKVVCLIMALLITGTTLACNKGPTSESSSSSDGGESVTPSSPVKNVLDKDYVYMWHYDGLVNEDRRMCLQTENYSVFVDSKNGKIIGADSNDNQGEFVEDDFLSLPAVDMNFYLKVDGNYVENQDIPSSMRIIDSGRYVNRLDNVNMRFPKQGTNKYGRIEYVATKTHVAVNYQLWSTTAGNFDIAFAIGINGATVSQVENGRGVKAVDTNGNGFIFLKQTVEDNVAFDIDGSKITFRKEGLTLKEKQFAGFGVIMLPVYNNSTAVVEEFLAIESLQLTAKTLQGEDLPAYYQASEGVWFVDVTSLNVGTQMMIAGRNGLERAQFEVANNGNTDANPTIAFVKNSSGFSITGMSPMLRNADTLEPTGEQVQISKNWHRHETNSSAGNYAPDNDPKRVYEGTWYHGYSSINVQGRDTEKREYTCAYGNWGGVYAASHAQLCLIGWGGNQLWDQSALGSWGESVTYDPDIGLNRSMIDDVRPFLVKAPTGSNQEYNWSGNVGGADFLNYIEDSEQRIINQKITYRQQAPNMTDVIYSGVTSNGKIATEIKINLGRTDDIVRNYYTIKYEFLEDVTFGRLSLFKVAADGYADNSFTKYAYGTENGAIVSDKNALSALAGYENGATQDVKGNEFWYTLYNSSNVDEYGDVGFIVREFNANLNGKTYTKPAFNLYGTMNSGCPQMSCEITVPTAVGKTIKKGSTIEMIVEYDIVPNNLDTYYGESDYLLLSSGVMGTADSIYQQVIGGHVNVNASVGSVVSNYPVAIKATSGKTAAQFTINGGLGYVPVSIKGLPSSSGYKLQVKSGANWVDVNQSVHGNDYWQAYKDVDGTYTLTYNVKNTEKLNFNATNEYRLIYAN